MNWKNIFAEAALLLLAAAIFGIGSNLVSVETRKLAWVGNYGTPVPTTQAPAVAPAAQSSIGEPASEDLRAIAPPKDPGLPYLEIPGETARRLHRARAVFIDARRTSAFDGGHIEGSRSIAVWERDAEAKVNALHGEGLPFDHPIVVYCSGRDCEDSTLLAKKLSMAGFYSVYVYRDGFPDWEKRGWPIRRGKNP